MNVNQRIALFVIVVDERTLELAVVSKLKLLDDAGETEPTERVLAVVKLVWSQHLLRTNRTVF